MFLHKFHQFYPFIQKLYYDNNNSAGPVTDDHDDVLTSHWRRHYKVKAVHIMEILIALDKGFSPALVWKF